MVKLRLKRMGRRHRPFYRISAMDTRSPRDGRVLEELGYYDPIEADEEKQLNIKEDRIKYWIEQGALASNTVVVGDLTIDLVGRRVERGGRRIDLSAREFALLECLGRSAGQVLSRTILLERVWDMNQDPLTNVVDVHINRLRKKVDHGFSKPLIQTIRGVGYVLREESD